MDSGGEHHRGYRQCKRGLADTVRSRTSPPGPWPAAHSWKVPAMSFVRLRNSGCLALAAAVAVGLGACSSTSTGKKAGQASGSPSATSPGATGPAAALFQQVRKSGTTAKSVRIKGTVANGAATSKAVTVKIDIAGDLAGKNNTAFINDGTGAMELLTVGGQTYVKADTGYWTKNGSAAMAKVAAGKYIKVPAASAAKMNDNTVGNLLNQIYVSAAGRLSPTVTKTRLNGAPVYLLTTQANDTKLYVSADGQARLLRVEGSKGQLSAWDFTQWNAVPPATPPPAGQVATLPTR